MKKLVTIALAMCLMLTQVATGFCTSVDSGSIQMADLFASHEMKPFDIGLTVSGTKPDSDLSGWIDIFPMDSNFGERNENTASFWELYDTMMELSLVSATIDTNAVPDYGLEFMSDGERVMRLELYRNLNIIDISIKESGGESTNIGRYFVLERDLQNKVFDNIAAFVDKHQPS